MYFFPKKIYCDISFYFFYGKQDKNTKNNYCSVKKQKKTKKNTFKTLIDITKDLYFETSFKYV